MCDPLSLRHFDPYSKMCNLAGPQTNVFFPKAWQERFVSALASLEKPVRLIHPWPTGHQYAFILTHDVETADGFQRIGQIADIEEELGFRSSWHFVLKKYPIDQGLLNDLRNRGFEVAVHGFNHDGRLFTSRDIFNNRAEVINTELTALNAVGFRAPMVHRNLEWMQDLEVEYDASCFDVDPYQAMPGGVGGIWPFIAGRFVELPYTLPQDHTLFLLLKQRNTDVWRQKLEMLRRWSGMALMLTHPDYLVRQGWLELYRSFLIEVRDQSNYWHALPRDVSAWWKRRNDSSIVDDHGTMSIEGPAAENAVISDPAIG